MSLETFDSVGTFDVNGDGQLDLVSGEFWYEGPAFIAKHLVGPVKRAGEYFDDFSTIPMDVNGDGRLDFITGGWWGNSLRWRENPGMVAAGKPEMLWPEHLVAETGNVETTRAWDVDGDGFPEIVSNNPYHFFKLFHLNRDASGRGLGNFREYPIFDQKQGHGLGFGDVNGDGRNDFVLSGGWLEAPAKPWTDSWKWHPEFNAWKFASTASTAPTGRFWGVFNGKSEPRS